MKPKALFICGPAGSGKSSLVRNINSTFNTHIVILNVDTIYEHLLQMVYNLDLNISEYNSEQRSQAATAMQMARKSILEREDLAIQTGENILIDGTGGSFNVIQKKKQKLEDAGYETMMVMVWCDPEMCLLRNHNRNRRLKPSVILRNWCDVENNVDNFIMLFDNFILFEGCEKLPHDYDPVKIKKHFFDTLTPSGIEYTPEEIEEKNKEMIILHDYAKRYRLDHYDKCQPLFTVLDTVKEFLNA